jgi:hypothetical protein
MQTPKIKRHLGLQPNDATIRRSGPKALISNNEDNGCDTVLIMHCTLMLVEALCYKLEGS